jgi:hypothetical protein
VFAVFGFCVVCLGSVPLAGVEIRSCVGVELESYVTGDDVVVVRCSGSRRGARTAGTSGS